MWQVLHDAWWRLATQRHPRSFADALACSVLQPGAALYTGAVVVRNAAYDRGWTRQARLPCRVVSVGNLTVGGTGKTACVELIARKFLAWQQRIAVLSRGYGGARRSYILQYKAGRLLVDGGEAVHPQGLADEPQLLARHLDGVPILIGARRDHTGQVACAQFGAQTVLLDDGFQHRRLARDCDIVLVRAGMPLGGWALLPRGPMREPLSALRRAHVIIITKVDETLNTLNALIERLRGINPSAVVVTATHEPDYLIEGLTGAREAPQRLTGQRVALLSSIGDPAGFTATVERLHAGVAWHRAYPDHHRYQADDWAAVLRRLRADPPDALVTTEKDWVRLQPVAAAARPSMPVWVLGIRMQMFSGERELDDRLARDNVR